MNKLNELDILLEQALGADNTTSKQALKQIISQKHKYSIDKSMSGRILDRLKQEPNLSESNQPNGIVRLINYASYGTRDEADIQLATEVTFEALLYPNGTVRESGRKMLMNLSFFSSRIFEWEVFRDKLLMRIERLIKQCPPPVPSHKLQYMEHLKPSVYKTLALAWYDFAGYLYFDDEDVFFERADRLGLPEFEPVDDFLAPPMHKRACEYPELQPYLSQPIPKIKLKYYNQPTASQRRESAKEINQRCSECQKSIEVVGAWNLETEQAICDRCAIKNFMITEGFKNIKSAEAYRRRLFDVGYLFTEMILDKFCQKAGIDEEQLEDVKRQALFESSQEIFNAIPFETKINLQHTPSQELIQKHLEKYLP